MGIMAGLTACNESDAEAEPKDPPVGPTVTRPQAEGEPRTVLLGLSTLPPERTAEAYIGAFATAAQYADIVLIQRAPPWEDFLPGSTISRATADNTLTERALLKQYGDLRLFYAIDPTDGAVQRTRIANLPSSVSAETGFKDQRLRDSFLAYVTYVARNYAPDYMALGVEVNMLYDRNPDQFEAFLALYKDAYRQVKATSPQTKVFPTFQLEDLEGNFGRIHPPQWELLEIFEGHMDVLAISSYPYLSGLRVASELRPDYYSQLRARWEGEIIISETGYASGPVEGQVNIGSEEDQQTYLRRLLEEAEKHNFRAVVWLAALDPSFLGQGASAVFRDIGLRRSDGANKLAWSTWEEWARRPLR
jgi:hypothetical protein